MQIGIVGLGKMGANMARRLLAAGHDVVGYDHNQENLDDLDSKGGTGVHSIEELVGKLSEPRIV
ncbi:MAG: NAD(P)-binding domain-containing protein, partial [Anaerolineales bacterium]